MTATDTTGAGLSSVLLDDLARLDAVLDDLHAHSGMGLSREEAVEVARQMNLRRNRTEAFVLKTVAWLDTLERGDLLAAGKGKLLAATTLEQACGVDPVQAMRDVRTAQALRDLPKVARAFAAGEVSRGHVDAVRRVPERCPYRVWREHHQRIDAYLAEQATALDVDGLTTAAGHLLDTLDPARLDRGAPDPDRRRAVFAVGDDRWGDLSMLPLPGDAALVQALLDAHAAPQPATTEVDEDGTPVRVEDHRSRHERRYDALLGVLRAGLDSGKSDGPGLEPEIRVVATVGQFEGDLASGQAHVDGLGGICRVTLAEFACTGILRRVLLAPSGQPLDVGRSVRYATATQRAALDVRDRGCVVPGCRAPAKHCQAHHVIPYEDGGPTDLWDLALVCQRHHREIHHGRWRLDVIEGICWVTPRDDPHRRRRRNLRHHPPDEPDPFGGAI